MIIAAFYPCFLYNRLNASAPLRFGIVTIIAIIIGETLEDFENIVLDAFSNVV